MVLHIFSKRRKTSLRNVHIHRCLHWILWRYKSNNLYIKHTQKHQIAYIIVFSRINIFPKSILIVAGLVLTITNQTGNYYILWATHLHFVQCLTFQMCSECACALGLIVSWRHDPATFEGAPIHIIPLFPRTTITPICGSVTKCEAWRRTYTEGIVTSTPFWSFLYFPFTF